MEIINILRGGLGNQLFQWATSKYLEIKYQCQVYQDIKEYDYLESNNDITKRTFSLQKFPFINYKLITSEIEDELNNTKITDLNEESFNPITNDLDISKSYKLFGYWQNYEFLKSIESIIRKELGMSEDTKTKFFKMFPEIISDSISLHVRRTDYLTSNGYHPIQPISYFENALKTIGDYDNLLIFSDDIEWCKENFHFKNQKFITGNTDIEDLWLMSLCKHNIISNSSFSWWAAWLNNNQNKKIIRPTNWYSYGDIPSMFPENWIKI